MNVQPGAIDFRHEAGPVDAASLDVLLVEDSAADAELVLRALRDFPMTIAHRRVSNRAGLNAALALRMPDLILCDFVLPGFDGLEALRIVMDTAPGIPLIFVSGTIGEEVAIDALQRGAADYVMKDRLLRLVPAIQRALEMAAQRKERVRMEQALQHSERRFRSIVESSQDWIWESIVTASEQPLLQSTYSNPSLCRILGYAPEEVRGRNPLDLMDPVDRIEVLRKLPELLAERKGWQGWRLRWRHKNGNVRVLKSTATPCFDANDRFVGFRGIDRDITEQLQHEQRIQHLSRIHAVLAGLGNATVRAGNRQRMIGEVCRVAVEKGGFAAACISIAVEGSEGLKTIGSFGDTAVLRVIDVLAATPLPGTTGAAFEPAQRAISENCNVIIRDVALADIPATARSQLLESGVASCVGLPIGSPPWAVLRLFSDQPHTFDGEEIQLLARVARQVDYAIAFIEKGERLEFLAYHNPVSGLPNRAGFQRQLNERLTEGPLLVAAIGIARFDHINASRGRVFADQLLQEVGQRLQSIAGPDAIVAHPGEDVFLLARSATGGVEDGGRHFEASLALLDELPYAIAEEQLFLRVHGGVALSPGHGNSGDMLERNAAAALDQAFQHNLRVEAYSDRIQEQSQRRIELEASLRRAFERNEFEVFFQPKFRAHNRGLVGAEALLRWRHPDSGLISPLEFIPLLEESGLIVPAGRWVMRAALGTALAWRARGHPALRIAVNVSARELRSHGFLEACNSLLGPHADDQPIDIEVTESMLMDDTENSVQLLQGLRALGCRVAIDDFGTGYSSLSYLVRLPVDVLKIDQSFVAEIGRSPETMSLITNIIALAHSLSLEVVAEGVEDEEQAKLLRLLRCDTLQGFLLGRPAPATAFLEHFLPKPSAFGQVCNR